VHGAGVPALDHGYRIALVVLTGLLLAGTAIAATFVSPRPTRESTLETLELPERELLREAA
jgi:hypothetical protein